jgi:hypothetical protein
MDPISVQLVKLKQKVHVYEPGYGIKWTSNSCWIYWNLLSIRPGEYEFNMIMKSNLLEPHAFRPVLISHRLFNKNKRVNTRKLSLTYA